MLMFLADENFSGPVVRGLLRRRPGLDIVRVQDIGLSGIDDPTVLEQAAQMGRVLLTHDAATIVNYAYDRVRAGLPMPGVLEARRTVPIGQAIDDILLTADLTIDGELEGQVRYLPL